MTSKTIRRELVADVVQFLAHGKELDAPGDVDDMCLIWRRFPDAEVTFDEYNVAMMIVTRLLREMIALEQIDRVEPVAERTPRRRRARPVQGQLSLNLKGDSK